MSTRQVMNDSLLADKRDKIRNPGKALRANWLPRLAHWCGTCDNCDLSGLRRTLP